MKKFVISYVLVTIILLFKNLIHLVHCNYIRTKFIINHKNAKTAKNYELTDSIKSLIKRANISNEFPITPKVVADYHYAHHIEDYLLQSRAKYIYRYKHALFWGYNLLKSCRIFSPIFKNTKNIFIIIISCFFEIFAAYLFGLYFDTTGIGNKILSALTSLSSSLIDSIR